MPLTHMVADNVEIAMSEPLIEVKDLRVEFDVRAGIVKAVDGLTLTINRDGRWGSSARAAAENL